MAESAVFFSNLERPIQAFLDGLKGTLKEDEQESARFLLANILEDLIDSAEEYDAFAPLTAGWVGESFRGYMLRRDFSEPAVEKVLALAARFVRENCVRRARYSSVQRAVLDYFVNPSRALSAEGLVEADYIRTGLPVSIINSILLQVPAEARRADEVRERLMDEVKALEQRIAAHQLSLQKIETGFNFVGLTAAFKDLLNVKLREKWTALGAVVLLGFCSIAVPSFFVLSRLQGVGPVAEQAMWSPAIVSGFFAVLGIEIVALYFFRVALRNYQISRSQITNLQLRAALCAFIEGYLDFRGRAAGKDPSMLLSFEQLIFSALPEAVDGLPNTLDGLAQVADIIRASKAT